MNGSPVPFFGDLAPGLISLVILVGIPALIIYVLVLLRRGVKASERTVELLERDRD